MGDGSWGRNHAPDFVFNAGGIITVGSEIGGVYRADRALELTERIYETNARVIETSQPPASPNAASNQSVTSGPRSAVPWTEVKMAQFRLQFPFA